MTVTGRAMTVLGELDAGKLGITLAHEHLNLDCAFLCTDACSGTDAAAEIDWAAVRRAPMAYRHNLVLRDEPVATAEVRHFADIGGMTIVDVTPEMTSSRDPALLKRISRRTGVNVIMGAGCYVQAAHPRMLTYADCPELAARFAAEVTGGVGSSGVCPGVLGEIGTGDPLTLGEEAVLRAAARTHREHGIPLSIHMAAGCREAMRVLDIVSDCGVSDLSRVIICHMDVAIDLGLQREVAARGAVIEYDTFGHENYPDSRGVQMPSDRERVAALATLAENGLLGSLLLSQDVCLRSLWLAFGGGGYAHLLRRIRPQLNAALGEPAVLALLVANPARVFGYINDGPGATAKANEKGHQTP